MRTVKRKTESINARKKVAIEQLILAYASEKQYWLDCFRAKKYQALIGTPRQVRDEAIKNKYISPSKLQARHWKLALQDAAET